MLSTIFSGGLISNTWKYEDVSLKLLYYIVTLWSAYLKYEYIFANIGSILLKKTKKQKEKPILKPVTRRRFADKNPDLNITEINLRVYINRDIKSKMTHFKMSKIISWSGY